MGIACITFRCTKCGEDKHSVEFPHAKGKRHSWCRACNAAAKKEARRVKRLTTPRKKRIAEDYLTADGLMVCPKCGQAHPRDHYQCGRVGWCRSCRAKNESFRRRSAGIAAKPATVIEDDKKLCLCCNTMKPLADFSPAKRGRGGVSAYCKPCAAAKYSDREAAKTATRAYRERHRERALAAHRIRMFEYRTAKKVTADGSVTDEFIKNLYATEQCHYCGQIIPRNQRTADHKTPLARGGAHTANNLVMACLSCNCAKRDMTETEFKEKIDNGN